MDVYDQYSSDLQQVGLCPVYVNCIIGINSFSLQINFYMVQFQFLASVIIFVQNCTLYTWRSQSVRSIYRMKSSLWHVCCGTVVTNTTTVFRAICRAVDNYQTVQYSTPRLLLFLEKSTREPDVCIGPTNQIFSIEYYVKLGTFY